MNFRSSQVDECQTSWDALLRACLDECRHELEELDDLEYHFQFSDQSSYSCRLTLKVNGAVAVGLFD